MPSPSIPREGWYPVYAGGAFTITFGLNHGAVGAAAGTGRASARSPAATNATTRLATIVRDAQMRETVEDMATLLLAESCRFNPRYLRKTVPLSNAALIEGGEARDPKREEPTSYPRADGGRSRDRVRGRGHRRAGGDGGRARPRGRERPTAPGPRRRVRRPWRGFRRAAREATIRRPVQGVDCLRARNRLPRGVLRAPERVGGDAGGRGRGHVLDRRAHGRGGECRGRPRCRRGGGPDGAAHGRPPDHERGRAEPRRRRRRDDLGTIRLSPWRPRHHAHAGPRGPRVNEGSSTVRAGGPDALPRTAIRDRGMRRIVGRDGARGAFRSLGGSQHRTGCRRTTPPGGA